MFELSKHHLAVQQAAREFAQREIAPIAAAHDESGAYPLETLRKMGEMGYLGMEVPEEWGGAGADPLSYVLTLVEIAKADAAHATVMSVCNSPYCAGLLRFGTEEQKRRYLVPVASGEAIGAFSLTEPTSGSDAASMKSRARLSEDGREYVVNGAKSWVTSGAYARCIILFTMTAPEQGHRGITALLIDPERPGVSAGKPEPKMGVRASATSGLVFDDYRCPVENRLGEEGEGFRIAMSLLDSGRIGIAAQALGIAEAALEASVEYAREREAFGRKIGQFQMIQQKLADMKTKIEAARLLIYRAALAKERGAETGEPFSLEASMAKLWASRTAVEVTTEAIQIHGGMGYSKELPLERYFRDAKITEIYEGTSEIQRLVIARQLTGLR